MPFQLSHEIPLNSNASPPDITSVHGVPCWINLILIPSSIQKEAALGSVMPRKFTLPSCLVPSTSKLFEVRRVWPPIQGCASFLWVQAIPFYIFSAWHCSGSHPHSFLLLPLCGIETHLGLSDACALRFRPRLAFNHALWFWNAWQLHHHRLSLPFSHITAAGWLSHIQVMLFLPYLARSIHFPFIFNFMSSSIEHVSLFSISSQQVNFKSL